MMFICTIGHGVQEIFKSTCIDRNLYTTYSICVTVASIAVLQLTKQLSYCQLHNELSGVIHTFNFKRHKMHKIGVDVLIRIGRTCHPHYELFFQIEITCADNKKLKPLSLKERKKNKQTCPHKTFCWQITF